MNKFNTEIQNVGQILRIAFGQMPFHRRRLMHNCVAVFLLNWITSCLLWWSSLPIYVSVGKSRKSRIEPKNSFNIIYDCYFWHSRIIPSDCRHIHGNGYQLHPPHEETYEYNFLILFCFTGTKILARSLELIDNGLVDHDFVRFFCFHLSFWHRRDCDG